MKSFFSVLRKIWLVAILGLAVRLLLMPITLHSDLWAVSFSEYLFSFKGVINIYDYLADLPKTSLINQNYGANFFTYPPLAYFTFGVFGLILKPFFNHNFFGSLVENLPVVLGDSRLYWHLFLTKLPYLFFDFGILWLLMNMFNEEKKKVLAVILWIFNPLALYTSYMVGQFDIIPVFFTILSLYLVKKNRWGWAVFSLGIGGAYKMFPLFFVPFVAIIGGKSLISRTKLLILGLAPYVLSILPFFGSVAFRQNVLFSNQSQKMLFAKINVSGAEYLSIFIVIYIFILGIVLLKKIELWKVFALVMLLFFSVTHYHPQWFLWLTPFLIIFIVNYKKLWIFPIILLLCWLLITLFFEPSLSIGLFAPLWKNLSNVQPLSVAFEKYYDVFQFKSLIRSIFAGIALLISIIVLKKTDDEE